MPTLTIGRLAKQAGVGVETIRFYEREGLITQPDKQISGFRQYPADAIRRIRFIRHAKEHGFTLKEVRELLHLRADTDSTCADVRVRVETKITDIDKHIASLERMRSALSRLAQNCCKRDPISECPILDELDREDQDDYR